jgi:hypothetical protein
MGNKIKKYAQWRLFTVLSGFSAEFGFGNQERGD